MLRHFSEKDSLVSLSKVTLSAIWIFVSTNFGHTRSIFCDSSWYVVTFVRFRCFSLGFLS